MDAAAGGGGHIWLDITTSRRMGGLRDGTMRVELSLIRELPLVLPPGRLRFCVFDRTLKRFSPVDPPSQASESIALTSPSRRARPPSLARDAARSFEQALRRQVKVAAATLSRSSGRAGFADARPGDVLLLAGENWSRYDFVELARLRRERGLRVAAVLQDMIPAVHPQFFEAGPFLDRFRAYVDFLATDADLVLAISDCTRVDFLAAAPRTDPSRVVRIELGAEIGRTVEPQRPAALTLAPERPFVLAVSTIQVRKNFDLLYRLWQRLALDRVAGAPHLVIVGREGFGGADLLHQMRSDPWIRDTVTILHGASDRELAWLYGNCAFTLYPSWYEGWGLPLSESLAYGKTFVASDRSSLPEAGQGLGIHVDPYDLPAWQREVLRLAGDAGLRAAMEKRIVLERRQASWADCARSVAEALQPLAERSR